MREHLHDEHYVFVFPTELAAAAWKDRALELMQAETVAFVAADRFIAWDSFKARAMRSRHQERSSIPSALRKLFALSLIEENTRACRSGKTPLFFSLIKPDYAEGASAFANWFSRILPSLALWFERVSGKTLSAASSEADLPPGADDEDRDLLTLGLRYARFLDKEGLFEPAWERPPFYYDGSEYLLFYPEVLADFCDYEEILSRAGHVRFVPVEESADPINVYGYDNSRSEISGLASHIAALHKAGAPWHTISVHIADMDSYAPYIERELRLHSIPFVRRSGMPLSSYGVGRFFSLAADCVRSLFSFDSLKELLLNEHLPWSSAASQSIMQLMDFGKRSGCICSWKDRDIWEEAFRQHPREERARAFYAELKDALIKLTSAKGFSELRSAYFAFSTAFFDMSLCTELADRVLARCVSELIALIDLEAGYKPYMPSRPFEVFTEILGEKEYLAPQTGGGVNLFPYKAAAGGAGSHTIVVGASQRALSVPLRPLSFLRHDKRKRFEFAKGDRDASSAFIALYQANAEPSFSCRFSFGVQSFNGYSIAHSSLTEVKAERGDKDSYAAEEAFFAGGKAPSALYPPQSAGLSRWALAGNARGGTESGIQSLIEARSEIRVSASSLNLFSDCSLKWAYDRMLKLRPLLMDTEILPAFVTGIVLHRALNGFFSALRGQMLFGGTTRADEYGELLSASLKESISELETSGMVSENEVGIIGREILIARQKEFAESLRNCLREFLSIFSGYRVLESEKQYTVPCGAYVLEGRIDLVLADKDDDAVIVDFKTGTTPSKTASMVNYGTGRLTNTQLALYVNLYEQAVPGDCVGEALFFSIKNASPVFVVSKDKKKYRGSVSRGEFESSIQAFRSMAEDYASILRAGGPFSAQKTEYAVCSACIYRHLCRSQYTVSGRSLKELYL